MKIGEAFPSNYLKYSDCEPDITLTIVRCEMETVGQGKEAENKPILYFKEVEKGLVCNKTNANTIANVLKSDDTDDWIGKRITVGASEVEYKGEQVMGIRVRLRTAAATTPAAATRPGVDPALINEVKTEFKKVMKADTSPDDMRVMFTETIEAFFGQGKKPADLTAEQWRKMLASAFQPPKNPLEDNANLDDIF